VNLSSQLHPGKGIPILWPPPFLGAIRSRSGHDSSTFRHGLHNCSATNHLASVPSRAPCLRFPERRRRIQRFDGCHCGHCGTFSLKRHAKPHPFHHCILLRPHHSCSVDHAWSGITRHGRRQSARTVELDRSARSQKHDGAVGYHPAASRTKRTARHDQFSKL